jgi:hypothetical protein
MAHTFTNLLTHVIFSTQERRPLIPDLIRPDLHSYMGGILRELHVTPIMVGGTNDWTGGPQLALFQLWGGLCISMCLACTLAHRPCGLARFGRRGMKRLSNTRAGHLC